MAEATMSNIDMAAEASQGHAKAIKRHRMAVLVGRIGVLIVALLAWEMCARWSLIDESIVSRPSAIATRLFELALSGRLLTDVSVTLYETFAGLVIGAVLGIAAGASMTFGKLVPEILEPYIIALYSLPRIALAPLFIVWFGIGVGSKIAVGASMVFFLTLLSTYMGMKQTDTTLLLAVKALGATRRQLLLKVCVPYAVPWIISSLKTGIGMALIGTIVGEFIASSKGIGWYISYTGGQFDATGIMAGIVVLMLISFLLNFMVRKIEQKLLNWKPDASI
jgi:NitT/TauT family transport system permease protein